MKTICLLVLSCGAALAQSQNPLTDAVMARYKIFRQNLIESAEAMPEDAYSFRLTPAQRPFGEWIGHTAMGNYNYCAVIKGQSADMHAMHGLEGKTALSKALAQSFEFCDSALKDMDDRKALTEVTVGDKKVYPVQGMIGLVSSGNEHYGNIVGYMRSKGITPPSSARAAKK
jgi:DinB family